MIGAKSRDLSSLLRGDGIPQATSIQSSTASTIIFYLLTIVAGSSLYGAAMGLWRDPVQAFFTAAKFPLVMLLTTFSNALLNGMLAPLLGLNLGFRQSLKAVLMSFVIASVILGAFSPILLFLVWNTPPLALDGHSISSHSFLLLAGVGMIAFAGLAGNLRLFQSLKHFSKNDTIARRVLCSWVAGNLFLGSQISWILRPFIGSPTLPVEFLRSDALKGSFFEAVFHAMRHLLS